MLIRHATLLDGRVADVRVAEVITQVAPTLSPRPDEVVVDAKMGALLPGLHDHHLHLRAAAASLESVIVGPRFAELITAAQPDRDGWIRAVGYHESVTGELDRVRLDALRPDVPLRVQHRSGAQWILNSLALSRIGCSDHPNGRILSTDPQLDGIRRREPDLAALSLRLAKYGVTGVTDATPDLNSGDIATLTSGLAQRVRCLSPGKKILYDDKLDLDALTHWVDARHAAGVPVALHCVTAAQLVVALAALRAAGTRPMDRIEHAAMVPDASLRDLAESGATVVTQPNFVIERGEQYLHGVPADEHPQLWRIASLMQAGIPVAGSTDAPFGALDPWAAMRAAVSRTINPAEQVDPLTALQMFLGFADRPGQLRQVAPGEPGDLCLLAVPPDAALHTLTSDTVTATIVGGQLMELR